MSVIWKMPPKWTSKVVGVSFTEHYPDNLMVLHQLYLEAAASQFGRAVVDAALEEEATGMTPSAGYLLEPIPVVLVREPLNEHDPNAIAICIPMLEEAAKIGHLPRKMAERLAPELDAGVHWLAGVHEVLLNPHYPERPGISIECQRVTDE